MEFISLLQLLLAAPYAVIIAFWLVTVARRRDRWVRVTLAAAFGAAGVYDFVLWILCHGRPDHSLFWCMTCMVLAFANVYVSLLELETLFLKRSSDETEPAAANSR